MHKTDATTQTFDTLDPLDTQAPDSGPLSWYRSISLNEKRAFWSCKIGYMMDAMDTMFLSFVIPTLIAVWHLEKSQAGLIGTVTLLASALGGWMAGLLSDRYGRVRALQITILWFAVFTLLCALAQNFSQLLVARGLMGLGFGGEWTAGAVLIGEVIRARDRAKAVGTVQAGWALGWGLAAALYTLVYTVFAPEYAWRILFALGILPAPLVIAIRRLVHEPEVHQRRREAARTASPWAIFAPGTLGITLRAALLATGVQGGYYAITTWLPTYLKTEQHLSVIGTGGYLAVIIVGSYLGYLSGAFLSDRLGRKINFLLYAVASMTIVLVYTQLQMTNLTMLLLGFPLGFFSSGIFAGLGAFLTELYPTAIRGSGQGFCYNFGRAVGATFPFLIGYVSKALPLGTAIGCFAATAYGVLIIAALTLPETRGKVLLD
jgi:MFS family permease